jgi:purine-binding chemotaxis protein CheW
MVDKIGDVLSVSTDMFEENPSTLDPAWSEFALGIYRLDGKLMVVLDVDRLLDIRT